MNATGIKTVIYCGAGLPAGQFVQNTATIPPALGFAGVRDLNYTELIECDEALQQKNSPHCLVEWNGKHEWPDSLTFEEAFYWMEFRGLGKASSPQHVQAFLQANSQVQKNTMEEWKRLKKLIAFLNGVTDVSKYISAHEALIKSKPFLDAIQKVKGEFAEETSRKQQYVRDIDEKDLTWWKGEVSRMQNVKGEKGVMNQRLLAYISLACYGLTNSAIKQGDKQAAEKILAIYQLVDPDNPDRATLQATLNASNK
jgi:hypothetical protein